MIVATAGHIDHGKTALIRALTGVDADRLPEEKRRGLTIDLGFAYTRLASGAEIGFVDVPGHERFLRNMLAGVLAVDRVLLVVAADDGPMPQTREHLAILALIGIRDIAAVLTKIDRVNEARIEQVAGETAELLSEAGYAQAPVLPVSSETGKGLEALRAHLAALASTSRSRDGHSGFRMAIDRCFSLAGVGTVVTGTVLAGRVQVGERLMLTPRGAPVRVRGIRAQDRVAEETGSGERCALAIAGARLDHDAIERGEWLVSPALHAPVRLLDAYLRLTPGVALRTGLPVHLHLGTADVTARLTLISETPGPEGFYARLALDHALAALHGDRIVLRDAAARHTLAGGHVADPFPPARRRARPDRLARLVALDRADAREALAALLAHEGAVDLIEFARARNLSADALAPAHAMRIGHVLLSPARHGELRNTAVAALAAWHARHPDRAGPPKPVLVQKLRGEAGEAVIEAVLGALVIEGRIAREGAVLRLPDHTARLSAEDESLWKKLAPRTEDAGLRPPRVRELAEWLGLEPDAMERKLVRFEAFGRLLRVAHNRFFRPATVASLAAIARALAEESEEEGGFSASAFARRSGIGRNLTIEVLEYLDRIGVTRRMGELRQFLRDPEQALG